VLGEVAWDHKECGSAVDEQIHFFTAAGRAGEAGRYAKESHRDLSYHRAIALNEVNRHRPHSFQ